MFSSPVSLTANPILKYIQDQYEIIQQLVSDDSWT